MKEISLHLLDIAENSIAAEAKNIQIIVCEDLIRDQLDAAIIDDGKGMDRETINQVIDPFFTSRTTRKVGLGIPLFKAAAESCSGALTIESEPGIGTTIRVSFRYSHIDRMPLGDLASTFLTLLISYPFIHWIFTYEVINKDCLIPIQKFTFDDFPVKKELEGIPLSEPDVLSYLRSWIESEIKFIQPNSEMVNITY
jgi:hypothetical protein